MIGSAEAGNACFTCITGESDPSQDYEIAEARNKDSVRAPATFDAATSDDSVPF